MRKKQICGGVCSVVLLFLALFGIFGLESIVNNMVVDNVKLGPDTYNLWGANPGDTGVVTVRNFTFYNMTNPRGFIYKGQLPKFNQMPNFVIQQLSNFTNLTYSQDQAQISYYYWLHFDILKGSRDFQEYVNIINLAPLSFWPQLDTVGLQTFALQGFGGLFIATNQSIIVQVLAQGVAALYLPKLTNWQVFCSKLQISDALCNWLWQDQFFGLSDGNNYIPWVQWSYFHDQTSGIALIDYFSLNQMQSIQIQKIMEEWCSSLNDIVDDWYCGGQTCNTIDLTHAQLGWSGLTANPPVGPASDSVCDSGNITCKGYPELYAYYKHVFLAEKREKEYQNLTFGINTVSKLFSPYNGTLLNIGNLTNLFETGQSYQKDKKNQTILDQLISMTHAQSKYHALVIWDYVNYFANEFVVKKSQGGTGKIAGLAGIFSQGLYDSISQFSGWFFEEFVSMLAAEKIGSCPSFIKKTTENITDQTINQICSNVSMQNYRSYLPLIRPCQNILLRQNFMYKYELGSMAISELCDIQQESLRTILDEVHEIIKKKYNCSVNRNRDRCTQFQIGAMQFLYSKVTMNPIQSLKQYPKTLSSKYWHDNLTQFQYKNYLNQVYGDPDYHKPVLNYSQMASLLSFDKMYSVPGVMDLLLQKNMTKFEQMYYWNNKTLLQGFIKFFTIQVGFGGIIQRRTVKQLIFGYEDPFLKTLKQMDPMLGGDPSLQTLVLLNDPNDTVDSYSDPQQMYTGFSDYKLTRNYISNFGKPYVTFNQTQYDGYTIKSQFVNPYLEPQYLHGTDGMQNKPLSTPEDNQHFYLDTLYRVAEMSFDRWDQKFGFDLLKYKIADNVLASSQQYPPNKNFYQGYKGFMNLSFLGPTVFMSKNHMQGADDFWQDRMEVYDQSGQNRQFPNQWDESILKMQPKSGATFEATCFLQSSFQMKGDMLFNINQTMMPIVSVYRGANLTQQKAEDLLGPLKIAIAAPRYLTIISVVLLLLVTTSTLCCVLARKRKQQVSPSLLQSTDSALLPEEREEVEQQKE